MSAARKLLISLAALGALAMPATASAASPAWSIQPLATPTHFVPGDESGFSRYQVFITNSGGEKTDSTSPIFITDTLPAGLTVKSVELIPPRGTNIAKPPVCETEVVGEVSTVSCEVTNAALPKLEPARLEPGDQMLLEVKVAVPPSISGTLVNRIEVEGGGAEAVAAQGENQASASEPAAGFQEFRAELLDDSGQPVTAADGHPYQYTTSFGVNVVKAPPGSTGPVVPAGGDIKEVEVSLPPGLAGNPMAVPRCTPQQLATHHSIFSPIRENFIVFNECPVASVVGVANLEQLEGLSAPLPTPIYNLVPPKGMPAQFAFEVSSAPIYINTRIRSESDYGVSGYLANVTQAKRVTASRISIWGTPWEESHDPLRGRCAKSWEPACPAEGQGPAKPFLRAPSRCGSPLTTTMVFSTWAQPPSAAGEGSASAALGACAAAPFSPSIEAKPSTSVADSPAGFHFGLHMPQKVFEDPNGLGHADLRDVTVRLPEGLVVNPSSADGLGACSTSQVGLSSAPGQSPIRFNLAPAQCPNDAKVGVVEANVPALDHPIKGSVFLAKQEENPFNSLIALYIVLEDEQSGVVVKLAGKVNLDPRTGQLSTVVTENPQVPVEDFRFDFFEGGRAPLRTPMSCGRHTTTSTMTPWTAPEGLSTNPSDSFEVGSGPKGPCPNGSLEPKFSAGFANPTAGTYSPFSVRLTRADGTGEFAGLTIMQPRGFTARLAGIPYCPQSGIDQAASRERPGQGAQEISQPSCPAASQIGTVTGGAGAGPSPYYTSGKLYLAGPYKGAPVSLVAIIPAVAGPFDLGVITNRVASYVDRETAEIKAVADPLPTIRAGVVLDVRDLRVNIDRPNFALAPTSCEPKSVGATVQGTSGQSASTSDRFQVGGCNALKFKPKVTLQLKGGTKRSKNPALKAVVTYPQKGAYANTAKASVALPRSEFLEQSHIRTICTRVQFAANACPKGAVYGKAKGFSPLLEEPVSGPVYLRSSSNPLPDLVLDLHGQVDIAAVARFDTHKGGIRASFESVPDVPIAKVIVEMQGGKKGLLVNSRNICNHVNKATAKFTAHNGLTFESRPVLKDSCKKKPGKKGKKQKKGKGAKKR